MIEKEYKYRFKTLSEFEQEYGSNWRLMGDDGVEFISSMDYLIGADIDPKYYLPLEKYKSFVLWIGSSGFRIIRKMIKKVPIKEIPNYKPKTIIYE
jgi:hypothetical protein